MTAVHRDRFPSAQYFLAVAGMAMMRKILSRPSEGRPRLEEIKQIVASLDEFPNNLPVEVVEHTVEDGYTGWAPSYDGPNPAIQAEEPVVRAMLDPLSPGRAVDVGCGTGRHAGFLSAQGFDTVGVDATDAMLSVARQRFPEVEFRQGRLEALPLEDESADVLVSALAACHAPDLSAVFAEFARVVRPGGTMIISDPHPTTVAFGGVAGFPDRTNDPTDGFTLPYVPNLLHPLHTYVNAAVSAGLSVVECQEPTFSEEGLAANPAFAVLPDAVRQAFVGLPFLVVWRFLR